MPQPAPTLAEQQRAQLRAFARDHLRGLAESCERLALQPGAAFGDARYFAKVATEARALIVAIG